MRRRRRQRGVSHELLAHVGRPCPYCRTTMQIGPGGHMVRMNVPTAPTRDHVIPKSILPAMGTLIVCRKCNGDKGNMLLEAWAKILATRGDVRAEIVKQFMRDNRVLKLKDARSPCRAVAFFPQD